jgi:hypothetical protein
MTLLRLKPGAVLLIVASLSPCQDLLPAQNASEMERHHLLCIIPNYRISPTLTDYSPVAYREKFRMAGEDSWYRGTVALRALFAVQAQAANSNRSFRQGTAGYSQYLGASYGDFVVGNYMPEGVFPSLPHQDPRYFGRSTGGGWSRLRYSLSQSFITRGDSGHIQPNYSEWPGQLHGYCDFECILRGSPDRARGSDRTLHASWGGRGYKRSQGMLSGSRKNLPPQTSPRE